MLDVQNKSDEKDGRPCSTKRDCGRTTCKVLDSELESAVCDLRVGMCCV